MHAVNGLALPLAVESGQENLGKSGNVPRKWAMKMHGVFKCERRAILTWFACQRPTLDLSLIGSNLNLI